MAFGRDFYCSQVVIDESDSSLKSFLDKFELSLESVWVSLYKLCQPQFGQFIPFFLADRLKLCQIRWKVSVNCHFQVTPQMFYAVKVWALAGPLIGSHSCPKASPVLSWLYASGQCHVKGGPSLRSHAFWSWFSSRISVYLVDST